ncbi:hypothetical protein [uncultured Methanobrevibacter sp.]|uniref:hypothetical protein n=1 Tax=uncultured Methanobrevibacter sp. TaxID=253161 RepID=UPI0025EF06CB|nr:hypothetical protein [uncultured Methanobrevibacter sp.]
MEFILNNKKYSIQNHELYINYLMVDNYFRHHYSKYDYDILFDFITPILSKEKVEFEDILEGTAVLEELIDKQEINFIPQGLRIDEHLNGNFKITYQTLEFNNVRVGEAIPLLIALNTLLNYKPTLSLTKIEEELDYFIKQFRSYNENMM